MCASDVRRPSALARCLVVAVLVMTTGGVHAQSDKDAEQVKRLRLQMRQMQQQQQEAQDAQAQADRARQQSEQALKSQEADLQKQRATAAGASRRVASLQKELDTLKAEHARVTGELAALQAQHAALSGTSRQAQEQAQATQARLSQEGTRLQAQLKACVADNAEMADLGLELLQRYENKGLGEVLAANEPFVQAGRVKLENLKAGYQQRLDAARVKPAEAVR